MNQLEQQVISTINRLLPVEDTRKRFAPVDVLAFCQLESSFNPMAYRFERKLDEASYGLMQILVSTAHDRGFTGPEERLYGVEDNLTVGIRQLVWISDYLERHSFVRFDVGRIAGAYNAGVGNVCHGFIPLKYVSLWRSYREEWRVRIAPGAA